VSVEALQRKLGTPGTTVVSDMKRSGYLFSESSGMEPTSVPATSPSFRTSKVMRYAGRCNQIALEAPVALVEGVFPDSHTASSGKSPE